MKPLANSETVQQRSAFFENSQFCQKCAAFIKGIRFRKRDGYLQHRDYYPEFPVLGESAAAGCRFCEFLIPVCRYLLRFASEKSSRFTITISTGDMGGSAGGNPSVSYELSFGKRSICGRGMDVYAGAGM